MFGKLINISFFVVVQLSLFFLFRNILSKRDAKLRLTEVIKYIFERLRSVLRQNGGIYCRNVARIKTVNRQRDIEISRLVNRDLKNN